MRYLLLFSFSIVFLLTTACSKPQQEDADMLQIRVPAGLDQNVSLADLAETVALIQLETKEDAFITNINNIYLHNEKLYVNTYDSQILVFDLEGKFLESLGKQGDGPGEYKFVSAMTTDEESGNIYVNSTHRALIYSAEHELLEEKKLELYFDFLKIIDNQLYGISQDFAIPVPNGYSNKTLLYNISRDWELEDTLSVREVVNKGKVMASGGFKYFISSVDNTHFIYTPTLTPEKILRDTLYQKAGQELFPYAKLNFEKPHVNDRGDKLYNILNIVNTSNYITSLYYREGNPYMVFYNKEKGETYNIREGVLDTVGDRVLLRPLISEQDMYFYVKKEEFADSSTEEMNPMIGIVKLKN